MNSFRKILMKTFCFAVVTSLFFTCINNTNIFACCTPGVTCNFNEGGVIEGTANSDSICGFRGNDEIFGKLGNDIIFGGCGDDIMWGGLGFDIIHWNPAENDVKHPQMGLRRDDDVCSTAFNFESDFLIKDNVRPVNSSAFKIEEGISGFTDISSYRGKSKLPDLKEIKPTTFVTYEFAAKGYSELTGLPLLPDQNEMLLIVGSYTITPHPKEVGVLLLKIPAYTKEDTQSIAAQLFVPDGEGFVLYDHMFNATTKLVSIEYIRFDDTALIPVQ